MAVIYGTQGRDFLEGTGLDDIIQGWAKFGDQSTDLSDQLIGGGGNDELLGGGDDDSLAGSFGETGSPAGAAATASSSVATTTGIRSSTSRMTPTRSCWEPSWA
jgi:Ca2+-binding RTX toxin-like protein